MAELKIKADSGGGTVSFKGPATTTSNAAVQLTLPVDDGAANQTLTTNGSGTLSWAAPVIADDSIVEAKLDVSNAPTNGQFLQAQSGEGGGLTWASASAAAEILAWVNFNGTGTVAIRDHYNVSSITDVGTGHYTVNFTNNLPNANYATIVTADGVYNGTSATLGHNDNDTSHTAVGSVKVESRGFNSAALADAETYCVACIS